jgi:hypothetical protein
MKLSYKSFTKKASNLYQSIHQQLSVYAFAAVVISLLVLSKPSEARIVYTPTHVNVNSPYNLDLNHDGITDFTLGQIHSRKSSLPCSLSYDNVSDELADGVAKGNGVVGNPSGFAAALNSGVEIGASQRFTPYAREMVYVAQNWSPVFGCHIVQILFGPWANVSNLYLGLEFQINGKIHYGWARLSVQVGYVYINATLTGYAFETIPGKSIKAGQTKGTAEAWDEDNFGPGASLTSPIPDVPQTASLATLALGAQGIPLWRRKESALEGN